jgi:predicted N-acetyltransferase YhbS
MTETPLEVLDPSALAGIAELCRRSLDRPPAQNELRDCLFAVDQPAIVRGDPDVGVVVAVPSDEGGSIRLLAVDPGHQGQGHGHRLLRAAEDDLRAGRQGRTVVTVGADPPYYLFPGVETTQLAMLCLLEREHYARADATFNMDVDLSTLGGAEPDGPWAAGPGDRADVDAFLSEQWPNWRQEALRALDKGTLVIGRDTQGITGFCAWDVNRRGQLGPVAVRLDLMGKGAGAPLLVAALHHMRRAGWETVEVAWVGPIVPYARVGGAVGRVFFVYRKTIEGPNRST